MNTIKSLSLACAAVGLAFSVSAQAQLVAYDEADNYVINANWVNGANQGFGFTPWAFATNGPDFHGSFLQSGNNPVYSITTTTNVMGTNYTDIWGLFANGTNDINESMAFRGFTNSLGTNTFKLQWGSTGAGVTTTVGSGTVHGWCGFTLRNGNATNSTADFQTGVRFYLYFLDGAAPSTLYIWDNGGVQSVPGTSFSDLGRGNITNAIEAEVTVGTDGNTYHLTLKDCVVGRTIYNYDGTLMGSGTIDSVALFNHETTGDQFYNKMQIAVPTVPPSIINVQPTNTSVYLSAPSTSVSFEVKSLLSTVASNTVSLYLNGLSQSNNLTFNQAGPTSDLLVNCSTPIAPDTFYTVTIVATDASGNTATNISTFNTFLTTDLYIDCGDYNYTTGTTSGQFVNSSTPANAYASFLGSNNIDYFETDLNGTNNAYRTGDLPQILSENTDNTGDPIPHAGGAFTIYSLGFTVATEWENYTRVIPTAGNYSIYARAASGNGGVFEVERLTNAIATTTSQPLAPLGRVNVPPSGGSKVFSGQLTPVTDIFGNTVVVPLSSTNTIRQTAISNQGYNLEYLLIVQDTNNYGTLRPYIATGNPAPNAQAVSTTSKITFNIANRQTTVASVQCFLNGTNYTGAVVLTNNLAGSSVFISPTNLLVNTNNTIKTIITDNLGGTVTNNWTFFTAPLAGSGVWTGGAFPDMNWATAGNWAGGVPGPGNTATFASTGGSASYATNSVVLVNTTIQELEYSTNTFGYHTTQIGDGVTLTVTNGTTSTMAALQVGGVLNGDNGYTKPVTNTITGGNGTLYVSGNSQASGAANSLNFQVRQCMLPNQSNGVVMDMSGLGTLIATVGKFYVAQGGGGGSQSNVSGVVYLARTNIITCLRGNSAGQFEVGDSSGGTNTLMGSGLYLGITNSWYVDTVRIGKNSATNNIVRFNPAFTSTTTPAALIRGTNGPNSRVANFTIGDADTEPRVLNYVNATVDFTGGKVDALLTTLALGRGEAFALDAGAAQGILDYSAGTIDALNVLVGVQRAVNTATEAGVINLTGTAVLSSANITLAQTNAGGTVSLVSGTINCTNGTIRGNINAGGGVSTVNLNTGTLIVSNNVGSAGVPLSALNLTSASLHMKVDGNVNVAKIFASSVAANGTSTITIDSVSNVTGAVTIHLISYAGTSPMAGLALAPLPSGFTGSLSDSGSTIDLMVNVAVSKPPTIHSITFGAGGAIIINGTNNVGAGGTYSVLSATNLLTPLTNWAVVTNGSFDGSGNFSSTNLAGTNTQRYFILRVP